MDDISHAFEALYLSHHDIGQARRLACEHPEFSSSEDQRIAVLKSGHHVQICSHAVYMRNFAVAVEVPTVNISAVT
jgi:hypothetical protein